MTNGTILISYQLAHKQYMSIDASRLLCVRETGARCSNGFEETSGMYVTRIWIVSNKTNRNLSGFWKCLDIWNISSYSSDIYLKIGQRLVWIFHEHNDLTFDKSAQMITSAHWRVWTLTKWFNFKQPLDMGDKIELNYWSNIKLIFKVITTQKVHSTQGP